MGQTGTSAATAATSTGQLELLSCLANAVTPREVAAVIVRMARAEPACSAASVAWGLGGIQDPESEPALQLSHEDRTLARSASARAVPVFSEDGRRLAIPLFQTHPVILFLSVDTRSDGQRFIDQNAAHLRLAGRNLGLALEAVDLQTALDRLERSDRLQRALFAISDLASSDRDMPDVLRGLHAIVGTLMYAENFFIVLHDAERDTVRFPYFVDVEDKEPDDPDREIPMRSRERSLAWHLIRDGKPLMGNTEQLREQVSGPLAILGPESRDWLGVPMLRDGRAYGAVVVQSYQDGIGFSADDRSLLEFVSKHILIALERRQGKAELEQRVRLRTAELQGAERLHKALFEIAQLATADVNAAEFYQRVHAVVGTLINAENFYIGLLCDEGASLEFPYAVDATGDSFATHPLRRGMSEYVLRKGEIILRTEDILALAERGEIDIDLVGPLATWWLGAPLLVGTEVIGLVVVQSYSVSVSYGPAELDVLGFVASQIANGVNRRRSAEALRRAHAELEQRVRERTTELQQLAHFDPLTALPNRTLFYETLRDALAQAVEHNCIVWVLFLDIDHFKNVNDTMGHACGDELLRQVGRRLVHSLRVRDTVGRLGGDEFAIILMSPDNPESGAIVANKLRDALRKPFDLGGREVTVTASIGITVFPTDSTDAESLIKYADTAMYAAKEGGRDGFRFYTAAMNTKVVRRLELDNALRRALDNDEFVLHYQPKMDLANGSWSGVEALLRWNRPGHGLVSPAEFIPMLEETGLIEPVGIWVINTACRQIAAWIASGLGPVPVAVNVSVKQLLHGRMDVEPAQGYGSLPLLVESPALEPAIERALREHDVATNLLEIELTESTLMLHAARTVGMLQRLKALGIRISIDDFGTGYSSLAYLKRFPIHTVKIDQTFVRDISTDPEDAAIAVAIISLAHSLKLKVVAEGVETREQLDFLRAHDCDQAQGYLLARPMPAEAVSALLGASRCWLGDVRAGP